MTVDVVTVEPTVQDLARAQALRESLLAFIEGNTKQRLVFRPYLTDDGETVFPTAHIDRELARILAQARAEGQAEALSVATARRDLTGRPSPTRSVPNCRTAGRGDTASSRSAERPAGGSV